MAGYSSSTPMQKNCSRCEYWEGDRSVINKLLQIQYISGNKYPCSNHIASRKDFTYGHDSCHKWTKWRSV
ncbi:MAG: hypothetical protein ACYCSQ_05310 [bacterium]